MGTGYTRQSAAEIQTGEIIEAAPLNAEFNQLQNAFDSSVGHTHDGTIGEGPKISLTGSVTGILPVANGGLGGINKTNATTAPTAGDDVNDGYAVGSLWVDVTNDILYVCVDSTATAAIWQRYNLYDAGLTSIAGLTTAADKMIYTTASDVYAVTDLSPYARTLLDDTTASAAQTTLGVSTYVKTLLDDADAATARGTLGLGTISTQASNSVSITGGSITGITDLAVADGGTGASTAANARTNLGVVIGTDVQAQDAELSAIAGLVSAADRVPYFTGSGTASLATFTAAGRTLAGAADVTAQRTTLLINNTDNTSDANKPISTATQTALDLKLNILQAYGSIASAGTTDLGSVASQNVTVTGTTTITSFGTVAAGTFRRVTFSGILTLTHNATSLILPQGQNVTTAAGESLEAVSLGSGNWRVTSYQKNGVQFLSSQVAVSPIGSTEAVFTGIPSWAKRVTVMWYDISTNGTGGLGLQIGPSSGVETSGYASVMNTTLTTSQFLLINSTAAAGVYHGHAVLTNVNASVWVLTSLIGRTDVAAQLNGAGSKTITGTLDRVSFRNFNGVDLFDNGAINIFYE